MRSGPANSLTDVPGLRVGHASLTGAGALSGTTVVLAPPDGMVAGVDVRGAAPATRETDLLDPGAMIQRVHALVFSGGSAYGLAAAGGVVERLEAAGTGFPVPGGVVPIVPGACLFDLGRGGDFTARPDAATGAAAHDAAHSGRVGQGSVGAGTGAVCGGLAGGVGTASAVLEGPGVDGAVVAALVIANAVGTGVDPLTGRPLGIRFGLRGEFPDFTVGVEVKHELQAPARMPFPGTATTLAVLATDITLDKAGCGRLAAMGHDGLARTIAPVHTIMDGDAVFGVSTAARPPVDPPGTFLLQATAADVVARAMAHALLAARTTVAARSYSEIAGLR